MVMSSDSICSEQTGYLGRIGAGCFDSMQLRAMMTTGTKRPIWFNNKQKTSTNIEVTSMRDERGLLSGPAECSLNALGLPPLPFMIEPMVAKA